MTFTRVALLCASTLCCAGSAAAQSVSLEFHDGKVNLTTQNASLRTILNEWARVGGTQVVNMDRLAGAPVTIQLNGVPETQALDIILRGSAGYIAGLRSGAAPGGTGSLLDRILVVPTAGTAPALSARPVAAPPPPFAAPPRFPQPDLDDNQASDNVPNGDPATNRGPVRVNVPPAGVNQAPPQPFADDVPQPARPSTAPANPFGIQTGSSRPGTITPVPQPPERPRTQPDPEP